MAMIDICKKYTIYAKIWINWTFTQAEYSDNADFIVIRKNIGFLTIYVYRTKITKLTQDLCIHGCAHTSLASGFSIWAG